MEEQPALIKKFFNALDDFRLPVFPDQIDWAYDAVKSLEEAGVIDIRSSRQIRARLGEFRRICLDEARDSLSLRLKLLEDFSELAVLVS